MRKLLYFILLLLGTNAVAQDSLMKAINKDLPGFIFSRNHVSFCFVPNVNQKAKTTLTSGVYQLGSVIGKGLEVGFNYHFNFNKNYSLQVGLHGGFSERNFKLHIPKDDFNPKRSSDFNLTRNETFDVDMYLSAPVFLQRRWFVSETNFLDFDAGFNVRFYPDDIFYTFRYDIQNPDGTLSGIEQNLELTNDFKPWIDYNFGEGYSHILHSHNIIRVGLLTNLSSTSIANGDYVVSVQGQPTSTGTYKARLSFVGISFSYTLTGTNKAIRKFYEQKGRKAFLGN